MKIQKIEVMCCVSKLNNR